MTIDEQGVQAILQQMAAAWNTSDSAGIAALFAEDASFIHLYGGQLDGGVDPVPNYTRDVKKGIARWDAYLHVSDPDALAAEFSSRNVEFSEPLKDTDDGLRGFKLKDSDGYVLFSAALVDERISTWDPSRRVSLEPDRSVVGRTRLRGQFELRAHPYGKDRAPDRYRRFFN